MGDLTKTNDATTVFITGANSSGVPTTPVNSDTNGNLLVKDYSNGVDGSTAPTNSLQIAGKDFNGNLQTLFTDTTGRLYVDLCDGAGNSINSYNLQIPTSDIINTSLTSGSITVSTTAVAARVSASNLTNRKVLTVAPTSGTVYLGATSGVTTTTGMPIFANQVATFSFSSAITPYLIAASSTTVIVLEGS